MCCELGTSNQLRGEAHYAGVMAARKWGWEPWNIVKVWRVQAGALELP